MTAAVEDEDRQRTGALVQLFEIEVHRLGALGPALHHQIDHVADEAEGRGEIGVFGDLAFEARLVEFEALAALVLEGDDAGLLAREEAGPAEDRGERRHRREARSDRTEETELHCLRQLGETAEPPSREIVAP